MTGNTGGVGKEQWRARAEVRVGAVQVCDVIRNEIIGYFEPPAVGVLRSRIDGRLRKGGVRNHLDQGFVVVGVSGETVRIQGGRSAAAVAGFEVEGAAVRLEGESAAALPNA